MDEDEMQFLIFDQLTTDKLNKSKINPINSMKNMLSKYRENENERK